MKTRSKESLTKLGDVLSKLKPSQFQDAELAAYKVVCFSNHFLLIWNYWCRCSNGIAKFV